MGQNLVPKDQKLWLFTILIYFINQQFLEGWEFWSIPISGWVSAMSPLWTKATSGEWVQSSLAWDPLQTRANDWKLKLRVDSPKKVWHSQKSCLGKHVGYSQWFVSHPPTSDLTADVSQKGEMPQLFRVTETRVASGWRWQSNGWLNIGFLVMFGDCLVEIFLYL
jgi:hypothetical protein